jgi:hypothetical protein
LCAGLTACILIWSLHTLGRKYNVFLYDGSFSEWCVLCLLALFCLCALVAVSSPAFWFGISTQQQISFSTRLMIAICL